LVLLELFHASVLSPLISMISTLSRSGAGGATPSRRSRKKRKPARRALDPGDFQPLSAAILDAKRARWRTR
jgi:hypothetical protein